MLQRPDSGKDREQYSGENKKAIVGAPVNDPSDHGYIPPVAFMLKRFDAMT